MALPRLNESLDFTVTVPSTGEEYQARPYLTQEEKLLLFAGESGDAVAMFEAWLKLIGNCVPSINVNELTLFDVENIFLKLRGISVGELTTVKMNCSNCKEEVEDIEINLNDAEVKSFEQKPTLAMGDKDGTVLELVYPTVKMLREDKTFFQMLAGAGEEIEFKVQDMYNFVRLSIKSIIQGDQKWNFADEKLKEQENYISRFNQKQMQAMGEFLQSTPMTELDVSFECPHCGHHNEVNVRGVQNFFS